MVKILVVSNMYPSMQKPYSGIFVKNQYESLAKNEYLKVDVYAMERVISTKLGSLIKYLKFFIRFVPYLFKQYDIIHVHYFSYHVFLAVLYKLIRRNTRLIVTIHGTDTGNIGKFVFSFALSYIDDVITVGRLQTEQVMLGIPAIPVHCIPSGVSSDIFFPVRNQQKKYDFIFVGSFYPIKGVDILIKAISMLNNRKLRFCFVGSGIFSTEIKEIKAKFNVEIKSHQTQGQLRVLYAQSSFLVLPTRGDSFGLVVSEAMFCGTPVIVSSVGGMKDQVEDNNNGFILEENTPASLANKMKSAPDVESSEYKILAGNALLSNKCFSMISTTKLLTKVYKERVDTL